MLDLVVFTTEATRARAVMDGGASAIFIDWEYQGKWERQRGADTEINHQSVDDLRRVRDAVSGTIICRINSLNSGSAAEIDLALEHGADELLLPMVRSAEEAARFLELVAGRAPAGVLVETVDACSCARALGALPLNRVYVGLNDLAIDRKSESIFAAVDDGTVEALRPWFADTAFGFGGLTLPDGGTPIPCRLLLGEILRLRCSFTFLRRSFWRDVGAGDPSGAIRAIVESIRHAERRTSDEVAREHEAFLEITRSLASP